MLVFEGGGGGGVSGEDDDREFPLVVVKYE
jgi:hypothetical protein